MLTKRSVAAVIIFSIITCGIYTLYWYWKAMHELDAAGQKSNMDPTIQFILLFVYVGGIIFGMNANDNLNSIRESKGIPAQDNKIVYILVFLLIPIVGIALVQNEMNQLAD